MIGCLVTLSPITHQPLTNQIIYSQQHKSTVLAAITVLSENLSPNTSILGEKDLILASTLIEVMID